MEKCANVATGVQGKYLKIAEIFEKKSHTFCAEIDSLGFHKVQNKSLRLPQCVEYVETN